MIQPILNKTNDKIQKSPPTVNEAKTWLVGLNEIQVSYDVVNLYLSVPEDKAVNAIIEIS